MDVYTFFFFFSYPIAPILIILTSTTLIFFRMLKNGARTKLVVPPGTTGWPILGESMAMAMSGPQKFMTDRMNNRSSDVFQTSLLGEKMAVFCGASGNKFLFSNETKVLTTWWPKSIKKALIFPSFTENSFKDIAALKKGFMQEILKPEALKHYVPVMDSMARDHIETEWVPNRLVKVSPLAKQYTFSLACKLFMGINDPCHVKKLADSFNELISGIFSVPLNFPGTAYYRACQAGKRVRQMLLDIIKQREMEISERYGEMGDHKDLLSRMLLAVDQDNDKLMNEMEVSNNIIGMLVASYDTTSTSVTFVLNFLAELPHVYECVYKEQMEIAKSKGSEEQLTWEDIEKMKYSWNAAREALRLVPPAQGAFREAATDFTYGGFTIPKGWKTFWSVHTTHRNPLYFPDPDKFDPSRFEGSGPAPFTFVPFGGGPRMCPGKEYARLEILVYIHNIVTRFKLEKAVKEEKIVFHSSPVPSHGVPVHLHPHKI